LYIRDPQQFVKTSPIEAEGKGKPSPRKKKKNSNSKSNRAYQPTRPNPAWVATALIKPAYQPSPAKLSWWLGSGHRAEIPARLLEFSSYRTKAF